MSSDKTKISIGGNFSGSLVDGSGNTVSTTTAAARKAPPSGRAFLYRALWAIGTIALLGYGALQSELVTAWAKKLTGAPAGAAQIPAKPAPRTPRPGATSRP